VPGSSQSGIGFPFGWYVVHVIAVAVIFTWLFNRTRGSVFLAMLLHAGLNAAPGWIPVLAKEGLLSLLLCFILVEWVLAGALIVGWRLWEVARE